MHSPISSKMQCVEDLIQTHGMRSFDESVEKAMNDRDVLLMKINEVMVDNLVEMNSEDEHVRACAEIRLKTCIVNKQIVCLKTENLIAEITFKGVMDDMCIKTKETCDKMTNEILEMKKSRYSMYLYFFVGGAVSLTVVAIAFRGISLLFSSNKDENS